MNYNYWGFQLLEKNSSWLLYVLKEEIFILRVFNGHGLLYDLPWDINFDWQQQSIILIFLLKLVYS